VNNLNRRTFLKGTAASSVLGLALGAGLLKPRVVLAAWPQSGFDAKTVDGALSALYQSSGTTASGDINVKAPDIAENGAVVPITISTTMAAEAITVIVEKNPQPLAANFVLGAGTAAFVSTRVKMGKTSKLVAVVKSGGKLHSAEKEVKVTIGGCGG
jgi:sulfur-oxidizing protein SoxY